MPDWPAVADRVMVAARDTFAVSATYRPVTGAAYTVRVIHHAPHLQVDLESGSAVTSTAPTFGVRVADLAREPRPGDRLVYGGKTYRVQAAEFDGQAGYRLVCQREVGP